MVSSTFEEDLVLILIPIILNAMFQIALFIIICYQGSRNKSSLLGNVNLVAIVLLASFIQWILHLLSVFFGLRQMQTERTDDNPINTADIASLLLYQSLYFRVIVVMNVVVFIGVYFYELLLSIAIIDGLSPRIKHCHFFIISVIVCLICVVFISFARSISGLILMQSSWIVCFCIIVGASHVAYICNRRLFLSMVEIGRTSKEKYTKSLHTLTSHCVWTDWMLAISLIYVLMHVILFHVSYLHRVLWLLMWIIYAVFSDLWMLCLCLSFLNVRSTPHNNRITCCYKCNVELQKACITMDDEVVTTTHIYTADMEETKNEADKFEVSALITGHDRSSTLRDTMHCVHNLSNERKLKYRPISEFEVDTDVQSFWRMFFGNDATYSQSDFLTSFTENTDIRMVGWKLVNDEHAPTNPTSQRVVTWLAEAEIPSWMSLSHLMWSDNTKINIKMEQFYVEPTADFFVLHSVIQLKGAPFSESYTIHQKMLLRQRCVENSQRVVTNVQLLYAIEWSKFVFLSSQIEARAKEEIDEDIQAYESFVKKAL